MNIKEKIRHFLDISDSGLARTFRFGVITLILSSSLLAILQLLGISFLQSYSDIVIVFEKIVLFIFTLELVLRVLIADSFKAYISRSINWIDIISVVPFYFGISNTTILRLFRVLRIMKFKR
jgi:voltage-gated sodium channel